MVSAVQSDPISPTMSVSAITPTSTPGTSAASAASAGPTTDRSPTPTLDLGSMIEALEIPEEIVAAIAFAAVDAYRKAEREQRLARQREYAQARKAVDDARKRQIAQDIRDGIHVKRERRVRDPWTGELVWKDELARRKVERQG